jgi:hypothetical protein
MHCHDVLLCLVICLALCFACITTCSLRSHETTRSLRFASMLATRSERFVLCERSEHFVLCDALSCPVLPLLCTTLHYPALPCLCFALPCHAFVLPYPGMHCHDVLLCTAMTFYSALSSVLHYVSPALQHARFTRMRRYACFCFASMLAKQKQAFRIM